MQKKKIAIFISFFVLICLWIPISSLAAEDKDVTNQFQDENLKNAILEIIRKVENKPDKQNILLSDIDAITADSLPSGKQLNLAGKNIKNLAGLELFENKAIEWIYLDWNQITDISILSKFNSLTKISASDNQITDLTPIQNLENLQNINFGNNQITSIEPITNLTNLKYLYMDNNQITSIVGIQNLKKLVEISMAGNKIEDVNSIFGISTLTNIDLSRNQVKDISQINEQNNLVKLNLNYNQLTNLQGIEKIPNLEVFSASNNQIQNIDTIGNLSKLYNLNLNKNELADITKLSDCTALKYLYLDNNHIIDVNPIEMLENLTKVTIYNQSAYVIVTKEIDTEKIQINLTSLFQKVKDSHSKIYAKDVEYKMDNNIAYTVSDKMDFLIVDLKDLEKEDLIFRMQDKENTYITLSITREKEEEKPDVEEPEENQIENTITNENNDNTNDEEEPDNHPSSYPIENGYIKDVKAGTNSKTCIQNTGLGKAYITRNDQILKDEETLKNGDILKTQNTQYTIIIKADPSGDGRVNITDLMKVKRAVVGASKLNTIETLAADLNKDGKINIIDVMNFVKEITK